MVRSVCLSFGPGQDIQVLTSTGQKFAMKLDIAIHVPRKMNPTVFGCMPDLNPTLRLKRCLHQSGLRSKSHHRCMGGTCGHSFDPRNDKWDSHGGRKHMQKTMKRLHVCVYRLLVSLSRLSACPRSIASCPVAQWMLR